MSKSSPVPKKKSPSASGLQLAAGLLRGFQNETAALLTRDDAESTVLRDTSSPVTITTPSQSTLGSISRGQSSAPRIEGRVQIAVRDCVSNPFNPREFYPDAKIHDLALTLKRDGQIEAIKVTRLPEAPDKYVVIDGERRLRAKKFLGDEFIDAELRNDCTPEALYSVAYRANNDHERQTVFDDAVAWKRLLDQKVFADQGSLGERVGRDKAQISKTLALNALPRGILERMAENSERIGLNAAYFIKLIFDKAGEDSATKVLASVLEGKKNNRELEKIVRAFDEKAQSAVSKRKRYDFRHEFAVAGVAIGQLKAFPNGKLSLELNNLDASDQEKLAESIKSLVDEYSAAKTPPELSPGKNDAT